jgi:hypothetical protein
MILPRYQCKLTGAEVAVNRIQSPSGHNNLSLSLQLKGFNASHQEVLQWQQTWGGRAALLRSNYPARFFAAINPTNLPDFGMALWILDNATGGDSIEVDAVRLRVEGPTLPTELEALLWSLSHLLYNYDEAAGIVEDRSNFPDRAFENLTATAKLAKLLALAIPLDIVDASRARASVARIAETLLVRVPRGPAGVNTLWPHFTRNGGTERLPGTEWASGDTAYAVLDLMLALKLIGDPSNHLAQAETFLKTINWSALKAPDGGFYHGYSDAGALLTGTWHGFGTETLGVLLAAQAAGVSGAMGPPPTDNGSGFILHAAYPIPLTGVDCWTNDWQTLRAEEAQRQLQWYCSAAHSNAYLCGRTWFGLSAAESPAGWHPDTNQIYQAYGLGGQNGPSNDGDHSVVALHYSGMVSSLYPAFAKQMWESMRSFGLLSPMNNVESISVSPTSGATTNNSLRGSWNLALQTEGWLLAMPGAETVLVDALRAIPCLADACDTVFPSQSRPAFAPNTVRLLSQAQLRNETLRGVVFGTAGFVAVGSDGRVLHSLDARAWVPQHTGVTNQLNDVAFSDGQYVAVGNQGTLLRSADGFSWAQVRSETTANLNSIVHGNGQWLAVGEEGTTTVSPDGAVWAAGRAGVSGNLLQAAFGEGRFIVAGDKLLSSTNALDWMDISPPGVPGSIGTSFRAVAYGAGTYAAVAEVQWPGFSSAQMLCSTNAATWAFVPVGYTRFSAKQKLRFVGGLFAIFEDAVVDDDGPQQQLLTSWDGTDWSQDCYWTYPLYDSALGNGIFAGVGRWSLLRGLIPPSFAHARVADGVFASELRGEPAVIYEIQTTTDLSHWSFHTNASHPTGRMIVTNAASAFPLQFYRATRQADP